MTAQYVDLHVHTKYSILDGIIRIDDLVSQAHLYGMGAVAITDHGVLHGAVEFYEKASAYGLRPIIGCEFYTAQEGYLSHSQDAGRSFHLVLLAMNREGYANLMKLASIAQTKGFGSWQLIDLELLKRYNKGLIALSACLMGEIPQLIVNKDFDGARKKTLELKQLFGDRLYLEIQENGLAAQQAANNGMMELGEEFGIKLVATSNCHYLRKADSFTHEVFLCLQTGRTIKDPKHFRFPGDQFYFKSPEEMVYQFRYCPQAVTNSLEIAERCRLELDLSSRHLPIYPKVPGEVPDDLLARACHQGLEERLNKIGEIRQFQAGEKEAYRARLEKEIDVIRNMDFSSCILITADMIKWAKEQKIPVGPGRGASVGSLVAFCLSITDIDPMCHNLLFEHFMNIERPVLPRLEVDFCHERRDEVIDYVRKKYGGDEFVTRIVTFLALDAKSLLRDIGKTLDMPEHGLERAIALIPNSPGASIQEVIRRISILDEEMNKDVSNVLQIGITLEGTPMAISTHATGLVIAPHPLLDYLPVCVGRNDEILTQFSTQDCRKAGLMEFNLLKFKVLTNFHRVVKSIERETGVVVEMTTIPMNDPLTFDLFCQGDCSGIYLLDSKGANWLLTEAQPHSFSDLVALVALFRPDPIEQGIVEQYIENRRDGITDDSSLPEINGAVGETSGVIIYSEQIVELIKNLAGYGLSEAELLQHLFKENSLEDLAVQQEAFLEQTQKRAISRERGLDIINHLSRSAQYCWSKAQATAYAVVCYQSAYLKANFPEHFLKVMVGN